jgi:hypothetical protein
MTGCTFNAFWLGPTEIFWLASGGDAPPTVELSDALVAGPLKPMPMLPSDQPWPAGGAWAGMLAVPADANPVALRLTAGGVAQELACCRPEQKRGRRAQRAAPEL